jgi:hypothetical protein
MEFERSGNGYLETGTAGRYPVRYYVRSYLEHPKGLYDSYGRIKPEDPDVLLRLMVETNGRQFLLILADGSKLPIVLTSSSGAIRLEDVPKPVRT